MLPYLMENLEQYYWQFNYDAHAFEYISSCAELKRKLRFLMILKCETVVQIMYDIEECIALVNTKTVSQFDVVSFNQTIFKNFIFGIMSQIYFKGLTENQITCVYACKNNQRKTINTTLFPSVLCSYVKTGREK